MDKNLLGSQYVLEDLLLTLSPLLERQPPSKEMCTAFSNHCRLHPRSSLVRGLFTTIVHRILKHNVDFGKNPFMRRFVQEYVRVLYAHNDGPQAVRDFVRRYEFAASLAYKVNCISFDLDPLQRAWRRKCLSAPTRPAQPGGRVPGCRL